MALKGDVATFSVRELLNWLADRRATGVLTLSREMVLQRFHLADGQVLLASSSEEKALLGRMLLARGLITPLELETVLAARGESRVRLGRALAAAGVVSRDALKVVLFDKIRDLVADALSWAEGRFVFDDGPRSSPRVAVKASVDLRQILDRCDGFVISDRDVLESLPI